MTSPSSGLCYASVRLIICKSERRMNVCGCVYQRGKRKGSKVTAVKKEQVKRDKRKEKPLTEKKKNEYKDGEGASRASLIVSPMAALTAR